MNKKSGPSTTPDVNSSRHIKGMGIKIVIDVNQINYGTCITHQHTKF
jgi:hypothetical protein